ncbi:MAG: arsenical resistance operon transcriptional repressor ArsD [Sulfobacillus acidophilus]|uniref:Arsenical resistance operon transcriptional repressor ArsD n=1 Tax=Sulfobacillus acidophilus TaxID=53633 RepID=A0A2T2WE03_9FIRM|nr:MAG: arsenical resistance operon transcriptional repressor ArsD [Sulfobacillus acidophilus]
MRIEVYDPELCCTSGVCGSAPDPTLIRVEEMLEEAKAGGATVARYQMSRHATAFTKNPTVYRTLLESGTASLPMVAIDGVVRWVGRYPTAAELQKRLGAGQEA